MAITVVFLKKNTIQSPIGQMSTLKLTTIAKIRLVGAAVARRIARRQSLSPAVQAALGRLNAAGAARARAFFPRSSFANGDLTRKTRLRRIYVVISATAA